MPVHFVFVFQPLSPADALRQMIADDRSLDLELVRLCVCKMCPGRAGGNLDASRHSLVDALEVLDLAFIFRAPESVVADLRAEAQDAFEKLAQLAVADA